MIDSEILAAFGKSLRTIVQKCLGLHAHHCTSRNLNKFVSSGSDPVHAGSEASGHYSSCFLVCLMGTGWWTEQTLNRQETSSSSCFCVLAV